MAEAKLITKDQLFASLRKDGGAGAVKMLSDDNSAEIVYWSSTGNYSLDEIMAWGLPGGRIVEFFGAESSGKTTAEMAAMIENARNGGINILADPEGTFGQDRYRQMGGNPDDVIMLYPANLEEFYDQLKKILKWAGNQDLPSNALVLVAIDTITMMLTKAELELDGDDMLVAASSRVNSRHLPIIDKMLPANTCLLILNQVRDKIGSMAWTAEGNIDTPGGRIIKHACSVRVLFSKSSQVDNGLTGDKRRIIGMKTGAKVVKSKIGPPFRKCEYRVMFDHRGVDNVDICLNAFVASGVLKKPVSGVYTVGTTTFKKDTFFEFIHSHPKWTAKALEATFTLYHDGIDVERYNLAGSADDSAE